MFEYDDHERSAEPAPPAPSCSNPVGQVPLSPAAAELEAVVSAREWIVRHERDRAMEHSVLLRQVRTVHRFMSAEGFELSTVPELALLTTSSEARAQSLLEQAITFEALPGGFDVLEDGRLTVEQAAVVGRGLVALAVTDAELVWSVLMERLDTARARGTVYPPRRLEELLRRLIAELLPEELTEQKHAAGADAEVTFTDLGSGSYDLYARGIDPVNAAAAQANLARRSQPAGGWDERSAGERQRDALVDLLTGRTPLFNCEAHDITPEDDEPRPAVCGCPTGSPVPCGVGVQVLVPLATALGLADVPAELVGHGALDAEQLAQLLRNAPALQAVFVDEHGTPVAMGNQTVLPAQRRDDRALRDALLQLAVSPPGELFPRHPHDHPVDPEPSPDDEPPDDTRLPNSGLPDDGPACRGPGAGHPAGQSGAYTIRPRLRRFLRLRRTRCEFPGCAARAVHCDLDHDVAWPDGPTCACNLGPLCRHHHRVKQEGWTKQRLPDGSVRWTSPTGQTWLSPAEHPAPPVVTRRLEPVREPDPADVLSPLARELENYLADPANPVWDGAFTDPAWLAGAVHPGLQPR
jgi:hypothetical protein